MLQSQQTCYIPTFSSTLYKMLFFFYFSQSTFDILMTHKISNKLLFVQSNRTIMPSHIRLILCTISSHWFHIVRILGRHWWWFLLLLWFHSLLIAHTILDWIRSGECDVCVCDQSIDIQRMHLISSLFN